MALQKDTSDLKPAKYTPWVFSRFTPARNIVKRMHFMRQSLEEEQVRAIQRSRPLPEFRAGDILEVRMVVPEAGKQEYIYKGVCLNVHHKGIRSCFKLYNVWPDSGGVVQHIPLYMPDLLEVTVVGRLPLEGHDLRYILEHDQGPFKYQEMALLASGAMPSQDGATGAGPGAGAGQSKSKGKAATAKPGKK